MIACMDLLEAMRVFVRVAETGGFSTVARELGTSQPTVSRIVAALEEHLGARLLHRSTRAVTLTDDGRQFYGAALRALGATAEVEGAVGHRRGRPRPGRLSSAFCQRPGILQGHFTIGRAS
jgi:DNA-binding transcriptional LysR family regulator